MLDWLIVFAVLLLLFGPIVYNLARSSAEANDAAEDARLLNERAELNRSEILERANRRRPAA